jgi:serine/threonine protein kinase
VNPLEETLPPKLTLRASEEVAEATDVQSKGTTNTDTTLPLHGGPPNPLSPRAGAGSHPQRFGNYELLEALGQGGMGVVFKARQLGLNRIVALKRIRSVQFASDDEIQRFHVEAEAAAALDHPGIVPIYEVGQVGGEPFYSMGYVAGESLQERLTVGPLSPRIAAELVRQIAEAVEYAHDRGIIHRDLKPSNILLDADGRPRVTDFGLAKRTAEDNGLTMTGQVLGTPAYMPPEQAQSQHDRVGPRSDVYALGAVLYALLTGRPPFQAATRDEIIRQLLHDEPLAPRKLNPSIPVDLDTIAFKCQWSPVPFRPCLDSFVGAIDSLLRRDY